MEQFLRELSETIKAMSKLRHAWDHLSDEEYEKVVENYPFTKDFDEVIHDMMLWKERLQGMVHEN